MPKLTSTSRDAVAVQFGALLRRLRLARGWSIVTAAQRSGMNSNYLGSLENGRNMPSLDTLLATADVYGVWAADLVRQVEEGGGRRGRSGRHWSAGRRRRGGRDQHDSFPAAASSAAHSIAASFASTMLGSGFFSALLLGTAGAAPGSFCSLREPKVRA